jgi:shikimate kinase/3-dehydroquinate synthase
MPQIFIYGPPGSGKSKVGKFLAAAFNLPFLDLDEEIEHQAMQSISSIMAEHGELFFRELETTALRSACSGSDKVIALGGGTLLSEENRSTTENAGQVILLHADFPTLVERLRTNGNQRPLLAGEPETKLADLLMLRSSHYQSFTLQVDACQEPDQVVRDIQLLFGRYNVGSMKAGYDVIAQEGALDQLGELLRSRKLDGPVLLVSDTNTAPLYGERMLGSLQAVGYTTTHLIIPAGEIFKKLDTIVSMWQSFLEAGLDRKSTIIALGGGVVSDLTGFAAATFMRGCNWVSVPTTLLAMVDASLGGKTGIDLPQGKNLIGAFHPPRLVLTDPSVLSTLPKRELRAGMAEVVKHGVIADPTLFELCSQGWDAVTNRLLEVVQRSILIKVNIIEEDPYEQGIRAALNFGHTIGHAVEIASGYSLLHGEAVAIGMVAETRLAERIQLAEPGLSEQLTETLTGLGLPFEIPDKLDRSKIIRAIKMDKKKSDGVVHFTLPVRIGYLKVGVEMVDLEDVL